MQTYIIRTIEMCRSLLHRLAAPAGRSCLFAVLLWLATAAGAIHIPGTPVPITLQTLVLMMAGLTLCWYEAGSAVVLYLTAGLCGLPVFAGGASTLALVGPSAGFLFGFIPGVLVTSLLSHGTGTETGVKADGKGRSNVIHTVLNVLRYFTASVIGSVIVVYLCGVSVQSLITGVPIATVALASLGFALGDVIKALVASLAAAGVRRLL